MSIKIIAEKFFKIEEELGLFDIKIRDVYFWELIRFKVFQKIAESSSLYGESNAKNKLTIKTGFIFLFNTFKNLLFKNPFFASKCDFLFIGSPRRKLLEDNLWWDLCCDPFIEKIKNDYKCIVFEKPYRNNHFSPSKTKDLFYIDFINAFFSVFARFKINKKFKATECCLISEIEKRIEKTFGVKILLGQDIYCQINVQKKVVPIFRLLLRRVRPAVVVIICSYGNEAVIQACKQLSICTVELQHGILSKYHLGYSFPGNSAAKRCFPDFFLSFGDYWNGLVQFPIAAERVVSIGYPFFEMEAEKYRYEPKRNQIIFISQGVIGRELSKFAIELSLRQDFSAEIIYKLHPGEYGRWRNEYPWLVDSGVKVVEEESGPLYKLLSQSILQVGVFSTVIYEGLGLGLPTCLVDLPGVEYMDKLIEMNAVVRVNDVDELVANFNNLQCAPASADNFFKSGAVDNMYDFFKKLSF
jgi:hypothetical protein